MKALKDFSWAVGGVIKSFKKGDEVKLPRTDLVEALNAGLIEGELPEVKAVVPNPNRPSQGEDNGDDGAAEPKAATKAKAEK